MLLSLALCAIGQAHMGMSLAGVAAREKAKNGDNYRSPHGTKICQGTPKISPQKTVKVGDTIQGKMSGGAAHGGGQCSMLVSVDEKTWFKIGDYKDCTTKGGLSFTMPKGVPKACSGTAGCTLGWLWTPMLSGTCEIYMNCYNLVVEGAMGGIEKLENRKLQMPLGNCVRPNSKTKMTTMFGPIIGSNAADPYQDEVATTQAPLPGGGATTKAGPQTTLPDNAPITVAPVAGSPKCEPGQLLLATGLPTAHKVAVEGCGYKSENPDAVLRAQEEKKNCLEANSLSTIAQLYDLQCSGVDCENYDVIFNLNKCTDESIIHDCSDGNIPTCMAATVHQICKGQSLKLPQSECGASPCGANGAWNSQRQTCLCTADYSGSQCQTKRSSVGDTGVAASLAHSLIYSSLLVVGFLVQN